MSMNHLSDGSKTGKALHDDRSESTNPKLVIPLDIGRNTDEVPTHAEIENILPSVSSHYPNNFKMTGTNKLFQK